MSTVLDQVIVSDLNRTPIVQIVIWLCLVTSLLAFLAHAGIKFYVFRSLRAESGFVLTSLVSSIRNYSLWAMRITKFARYFALHSLSPFYYKLSMDLESHWRP